MQDASASRLFRTELQARSGARSGDRGKPSRAPFFSTSALDSVEIPGPGKARKTRETPRGKSPAMYGECA